MFIQQASKLLSALSVIPMVFFSNISAAGNSLGLTQSAQAAGTGTSWWLIATVAILGFGIAIFIWAMTKDSSKKEFSQEEFQEFYKKYMSRTM